ncbi:hypothetical protein OKA05_04470 [Luteolibacter arcticus]|uniref:Uncharacterized protein n=1 Tax=Luteolibacter arcticus TaxID=1581411 RepID=A0ABT3GDU1_9BACT|nr:hypothetical protein [Luteolibacter arcticus]MCW1921795.1 hypothetical protein [Luteolibacter arcticus]
MRLLLLLLATVGFSSCSLFKDDEEEPAMSETKPSLVGRIASVQEGSGFVLIEAYGPWKVPDGGLLSGIGTEGRTANLVATGEKLGQFSAADIRSGVAKVGDSVYYRPIKEENATGGSVETPSSSPSAPELETKTTAGEFPPKP